MGVSHISFGFVGSAYYGLPDAVLHHSTVAVGSTYTLYLDQWGISGATGSQCSHLTSFSGTTVAWVTTWTWSAGSGGVKTFSNIAAITNLNKQLSAISTIPVRKIQTFRSLAAVFSHILLYSILVV